MGACEPALTEPLTWGRVLNGVGKGFGFLGHIFTPVMALQNRVAFDSTLTDNDGLRGTFWLVKF